MRTLKSSSRFRKQYALLSRRGWDVSLLDGVIGKIASNAPTSELFKDHPLRGAWIGKRECHVTSVTDDWLVIYERVGSDRLYLHATGDRQMLYGE